jgi:hypothetical protein
MNITSRISRRAALRLLRHGSAAALTARMLGLSTPADAQTADPRRLIVFFPQHAILDRNWRQSLDHRASLASSRLGGIFSVFERDKYRALKNDITIIDGIYNQVGPRGGRGDAHDWSTYSTLTGISRVDSGSAVNKEGSEVQSLDLFLVRKLGITTRAKRPLFQFVRGQYGLFNFNNRGILSPGADTLVDPVRAFDLLFGSGSTSGGTAPPTSEQAAQLLKVQKLYVERLRSELRSMKSVVDQGSHEMLEKHLASMSELESFFQTTFDGTTKAPPSTCKAPGRPDPMNFQDMANLPRTSQLYFDVATAALACDRTRIITMQYLNNTDNTTYLRMLPNPAFRGRALHDHVAHASNIGYGNATHAQLNLEAYTWFMEMYAELLLKLKAANLLDSTTVFFNIDMSGGNHTFSPPQPVVVAGGGGKKADGSRVLRQGRYLKYGREPHTKLLLTLAHAMGANRFETFGTVTSRSNEHGLLSDLLA